MKLYTTDITVAATAYVLADSDEEAVRMFNALHGEEVKFSARRQVIGDGIEMSGCQFGPNMPEVSLSPVMTIRNHDYRMIGTILDFQDEEEKAI